MPAATMSRLLSPSKRMPSVSVKRFFCSLLVASLFGTSLPAWAANPTEFVNTKSRSVSRIEFLEWTLKSMDIAMKGECDLSYKTVSVRSQKILCALEDRDVLEGIFPDAQTDFTKPITRGEAIIILTALTNAHDTADVKKFRDSRTKDPLLLRAMQNAVARKWLTPLRATYFGVTRNLTGTEALSLLQSATNQNPVKQKVKIKIDVLPPQINSPSTQVPNAELIQAVWQLLQRDYLRSSSIDEREASYKMIEGMVNSLGDPYTTFFRPVQADQFQTQIKGELTGIGAHVEVQSGSIVIVTPLPNSPAEKAGLLPGDIILKADNTTLTGLPLDLAVSYIRGKKGPSVNLLIQRGSSSMNVTVVRDTISIPEIDISSQGSLVIVKLAQFGDTTDANIRSVMEKVAAKNPSGIVVDLRNNPGGLLHAADMLVSAFVPKNSVVALVKGKNGISKELTDFTPIIDADIPVVVLVNNGSASASEIVAGALQDYKRAKIVGTKTYGKGTVQEVLTFQSGEALKITIGEWLTPLGRTIDKIGVQPDIVTTDTATPDQQLKAAINALR